MSHEIKDSHSMKKVAKTVRIQSWYDSGLSQNAWCRQNGIRPSQFGYWKKKLSGLGKAPFHHQTSALTLCLFPWHRIRGRLAKSPHR